MIKPERCKHCGHVAGDCLCGTISAKANIYNSTIGEGTKVAAFAEIGGAVIGRQCKIQCGAFIPQGVTLGDRVFIGPHAVFTNDPYPRAVGEWTLIPTVVEDGVSIGAGAIILPGVRIGKGASVAAGSVVTRSVPPEASVRGNPAR